MQPSLLRPHLLALALPWFFACAVSTEVPSHDDTEEEPDEAEWEDEPSAIEEDTTLLDASDAKSKSDARARLDATEPASDASTAHDDDESASGGSDDKPDDDARDASATSQADARVAPPPVTDAATTPLRDAATARDAATSADAGSSDAAARDASTAPPSQNRCQRSSDCRQICVFIGVAACCREDHTCGCTWAPGAYCL